MKNNTKDALFRIAEKIPGCEFVVSPHGDCANKVARTRIVEQALAAIELCGTSEVIIRGKRGAIGGILCNGTRIFDSTTSIDEILAK